MLGRSTVPEEEDLRRQGPRPPAKMAQQGSGDTMRMDSEDAELGWAGGT